MILSIALPYAVRIKLIVHNPAADVAKVKPAEREMRFMTDKQVKLFIASAQGQRLYALFMTAVGAGMRHGELRGLQLSDMDFDKGTVEVKRSLGWVKQESGPGVPRRPVLLLNEPKSKAGKRTIGLPRLVLKGLCLHRTGALQACRITAPVFCTSSGKHIDKHNVLRSFNNVVKKANAAEQGAAKVPNTGTSLVFANIRFHDLRHTHVSCLIAAGHSIKAVSRRLGHGSIDITLRVCAHLMPNDDEKVTHGVEALFG